MAGGARALGAWSNWKAELVGLEVSFNPSPFLQGPNLSSRGILANHHSPISSALMVGLGIDSE